MEKLKIKAFSLFDSLKKGDVLIINEIATRDPQSFIQYAKDYIDAGGGLLFSNDYTSIRKCDSREETKVYIEKLDEKWNDFDNLV